MELLFIIYTAPDICIPPQNVVRCVGVCIGCRSAAAQYRRHERREASEDQDPEDLFPILFCLAVACIIELPLAPDNDFRGRRDLMGYLVPRSHRSSDAGTPL